MSKHKFRAGQTVNVPRGNRIVPAGTYRIVRALPVEAAHIQYRVKAVFDGHERIVWESEIVK